MLRATVLLLAIGVFLSGCVTYRGTITGVVVQKNSNEAMSHLEVYHYVRRKTDWPEKLNKYFRDSSKVLKMEAQKTTRFGDFKFNPTWCLHIPFLQSIDQERIIVNLALQPQLLVRTFNTGIHMSSWTDPAYVTNPDPKHMGVVVDIKGSLLWPGTKPNEPLPRARQDQPFSQRITNKRDLGDIALRRRLAPRKPTVQRAPAASPAARRPATALPTPDIPASGPALQIESLVPAATP